MRTWIVAAGMVLVGVGAGCTGGDDDDDGAGGQGSALLSELDAIAVDTTGKVQAFSLGSAPNAFYQSYLPIFTADINLQFGGTCPTKTEEGSTVTYTGGCTDDDGDTWAGTAVQSMSGAGSSISYEGFGFASITSCGGMGYATGGTWDGGIELSGTPAPGASISFEADLVVELEALDESDCSTGTQAWGVVLAGEMSEGSQDGDGDGEPDTQIFSGSGQVGVDVLVGDVSIEGKVETETLDEVVTTTFTSDTSFTLCSTEALSGETTHEGGGSVTVITYDGDTDCDADSTVTWTLDGTAQGEVAGVACSVAAVGAPATGVLWLTGGCCLVLALRRRR